MVYVCTAVVSAVTTFFSLQLWRADLRVPFWYWGDAVAVAAHFKTVIQTGWYEYQPLLGAPAGQVYHDFPTADNLNFAAAHVLGWFTADFAVAMNVYYIAGFVLAAVGMVWFLRECGVSRTFTVVLAVLFAIAPYHFMRAEGHLWLASYFTLPLALVVVLRSVRGEALWGVRPHRWRVVAVLTGRGASTVLCLALLATASTYYAVFVAILLAAGGVIAWWRDRDVRRLVGVVAAGVVLVATVLANMAPDLLYSVQHGSSADGLVRDRTQVEIYALKLSQLLLPVPGHRVGFLAHVRAVYDATYPLISERPALGAVAAFGLVCALVIAVLNLGARGGVQARAIAPAEAARTRTLVHLSALVVVAFLCSTTGGLATLLSFVTASLRGWNRMSIVIAALCLAITGIVLDAWLARVVRGFSVGRTQARVVAGAVAVVVLAGGAFDQVTASAVPDYAGSKVSFQQDATWFGTVESLVAPGSMVFQLPYAGFPETPPVNGVFDTDQLKPYLHTTTLRWSGAAIKGRATSDWPDVVAGLPTAEMVTQLAAVGFAAVMVDRQALGTDAARLDAELATAAGPAVAVSADGRYSLYSLQEEVDAVRADNPPGAVAEVRDATVRPVVAYPGADLAVTTDEQGARVWTTTGATGSMTFDNETGGPVRVRIRATFGSGDPGVTVTLRVAGHEVPTTLVAGSGALDDVIEIGPGQTVAQLVSSSGAVVSVMGVALSEPDLPVLVR
jgi:hypothetical protein